MTPRRRIAITGIGMVTPVGNDAPTTWANLRAGKSGVAPIRGFNALGFPSRIGAEVKNFKPENVIKDRKLLKFASPSHRFALVAAEERRKSSRRAIFARIWELAQDRPLPASYDVDSRCAVPALSEGWYCCAEPTAEQLAQI